jgi:TonB family protein
LDPTDPTVAQGIRDLSNELAEEARKSLAAGKNDDAQQYLTAARQLGAAGANLAAVERALAEANRAAAAPRRAQPAGPTPDDLVANIRQRISQGKLIDPAGDSARDILNNLRAAAPNRPEVEELSRALSTRLLEVGKQAMNAKAFDRSAQLIAGARDVGARYNEAAIAQAERDLTLAREQQNVVSAATLKRTKMVAPVYPSVALKKGIEGWVEVSFNVTQTGAVEDVEVRNSSPAEVFDDAAVRAVKQWRFEPVARNGVIVEQRAITRLRFSPGDGK